MISEEDLKKEVRSLLKGKTPQGFPYARLAEQLTQAEENNSLKLSVYGFIMYLFEHYGANALYANVINSKDALKGFVDMSVSHRDDFPVMLFNAAGYAKNLLTNIGDTDMALKSLDNASAGYVLHVLFKSAGDQALADRYRAEFDEHMRRYPAMLDRLPEYYRKAVGNA